MANFESICEHMVEKFDDKDAKNGNFSIKWNFERCLLEKLELYNLVENDKATASEIMLLSYLTGAITKADYADYLKIEKTYKD